jgi:urease accessory protein UreE
MEKFRIHIENPINYIDQNVFIDIQLPSRPNKGDIIYLTDSQLIKLESLATAKLHIAKCYFNWFFGGNYEYGNIQEKDIDKLNFDDAVHVKSICYVPDQDFVHITLGDSDFEEH